MSTTNRVAITCQPTNMLVQDLADSADASCDFLRSGGPFNTGGSDADMWASAFKRRGLAIQDVFIPNFGDTPLEIIAEGVKAMEHALRNKPLLQGHQMTTVLRTSLNALPVLDFWRVKWTDPSDRFDNLRGALRAEVANMGPHMAAAQKALSSLSTIVDWFQARREQFHAIDNDPNICPKALDRLTKTQALKLLGLKPSDKFPAHYDEFMGAFVVPPEARDRAAQGKAFREAILRNVPESLRKDTQTRIEQWIKVCQPFSSGVILDVLFALTALHNGTTEYLLRHTDEKSGVSDQLKLDTIKSTAQLPPDAALKRAFGDFEWDDVMGYCLLAILNPVPMEFTMYYPPTDRPDDERNLQQVMDLMRDFMRSAGHTIEFVLNGELTNARQVYSGAKRIVGIHKSLFPHA